MYNDDNLYWIWLAEKCGPASKAFARIIARFENPFEIYRLESEELDAIDFINESLKNALSQKSLEQAYSILKYCKHNGIEIISYGSERYPSRLKTLEDPPAVLYCLGKLPDFDKRLCIGVVGTRKISAYGMQSSYKISYELASANACIISGMALGVDAVAACGALEAGGDTVAVLGCGIDIVYPRAHSKLKNAICKNGAVISEFPPSEAPNSWNFPKRNRIISGLSQGVLIVEGNSSSGAMITAKRAIYQGREVFALPGKINESNSDGPNELIRNGANVALSSDDIVLHYDFLYHDVINYRGLKHARHKSGFKAACVEKYGVSSEVVYLSSDTVYVQSQSDVTSKSTETSIQNNTKIKSDSAEVQSTAVQDVEKKTSSPDNSAQILEGLDALSRRVFELMPIDRACTPDEFLSAGIGISEAVTSLTMLELCGLAVSLPGGTYIRK